MATGLGASKRCRVAAAHHGQHAVLRAGLAAGHRRVDELQAQRLRAGIQLARHIGRRGGVVDKDGAGPCRQRRRRRRGCRVDHAAQVVVVADAAEHDVGACGGLARVAAVLRGAGWPRRTRHTRLGLGALRL
jgi:hypothetical protein